MSRLSNARTELENYEKTRPADYVSQYQPKIKDVMGQLDGMKEFDYDPDADTAYQQYKSQYTRSAKLANQNAQANAAAQTGGYHANPRFSHQFRSYDIVFLVEPCLYLYIYSYLFSLLCCIK